MPRAQYFVVFHEKQWKIRYEGKHYGPFKTQKEAIQQAIMAAKKSGLKAQVLVQGEDNRFRTEWTYGNDPYPPKG